MKINNIFCTVMCILTLSCVLSCDKDDETGGDFETNTFRVKEIITFDTYNSVVEEEKSVLSYINELLTEVIGYEKENGTWIEEYKSELNYQGDWVNVKDYDKEGGMWVEENYEFRFKVVNGRLEETQQNYGNETYSVVLNYSGDKLISIQEFENGVNDNKAEFIYDGDELQEVRGYYYDGSWELQRKEQFNYSGGRLANVISSYYYNENWEFEEKNEYSYSGDKVIQIDEYYWSNNSWETGDSTYFEYNSEGLLVSRRTSYSDDEYWETAFIYEEGRGNLKLFMEINNYYYNYNYPTPQKPTGKTKAIGTRNNKSFKGKLPLSSLFN